MLKKTYSKSGRKCRTTFKLPADASASEVYLCGDFNAWSESEHPMKQRKDGSFSLTLSLDAPGEYRFRYRLDGVRWENDWAADAYLPNEYGSEDSVLRV